MVEDGRLGGYGGIPAGGGGALEELPELSRVLTDVPAAVLLVDLDDDAVIYASPGARDLADVDLPIGLVDWAGTARLRGLSGGVPTDERSAWARISRGEVVVGEALVADGATSGEGLWLSGFPFELPELGAALDALPAGLHRRAIVLLLRLASLSKSDQRKAAAATAQIVGQAGEAAREDADAFVGSVGHRAVLALDLSVSVSDPLQPDNPLVWVNPAFTRVTGYSYDEAVGRNCRFLQGSTTNSEGVDELRAAIAEVRSTTVVLLNYRKDGMAFWNEVALSPVFDADGELTNFVAVQTDVTARVAAELDREVFHQAEREARRAAEEARADAEQAQLRLALVAEGTALLAASIDDPGSIVDRLAQLAVPVLADLSVIDLLESPAPDSGAPADCRVRRSTFHHRDDAVLQRLQALSRPSTSSLAESSRAVGRVLRTGRSLLVHGTAGEVAEQLIPELLERRDRLQVAPVSAIVVPLRARGQLLGTWTLITTARHTSGSGRLLAEADRVLIEDLGARAALVLANVRLYGQEHSAAVMLQRSLLPQLPSVPGLELAARYRPGAASAEVGGDWFDAFQTVDGSTAVVIGDVVGHDLAAAARMGRMRNLLRGAAYDMTGPAAALQRLELLLEGLAAGVQDDVGPTGVERDGYRPSALGGPGDLATIVVARINRSSDGAYLTWSNAGHPPPLVIEADGTVQWLDDEPDVMLGVGSGDLGDARRDHTRALTPGSTVLLYTDGLVERRDKSLDDGLDRLAARCEGLSTASVDDVCDEVLAALGSGSDDICVLAVRLPLVAAGCGGAVATAPDTSETIELPAAPVAGALARQFLRDWSASVGLARETQDALLLVSHELVSNAYQHGRSQVVLSVSRRHRPDGQQVIRVDVDDDNSRAPLLQPADSQALDGRGLAIVDALSTAWGFIPREGGKTVWFEMMTGSPDAQA